MRNGRTPLLTLFPRAQFIKSFISNGVLQDHSVLQKRLRAILGADVTFADAYKKTGAFEGIAGSRVLSVVSCTLPSWEAQDARSLDTVQPSKTSR